ncbi:tripartite-type tricarboxylate transporter receptor subunit TctC [Variovorax boronicumulans]|uniref:Tripartite-type tricarboxylate transporter receptor subunit TctC n=1 Tax=Variovorax boronicumulans TaxID=436515 RepID=A0AAW8DU91_9BURK|nr:tripartite tricarboxylate transporter substrate binding protein [Variovorax boronicumulans]MDP9877670.1 tripartite-type tricarboxylate transporter receptor subunit TctC [Variovorax boronicumulans]MDP9922955.1 tripartite-type tricarboxylate transporter receptor subunit TctC [Variovorax boronicumulans]
MHMNKKSNPLCQQDPPCRTSTPARSLLVAIAFTTAAVVTTAQAQTAYPISGTPVKLIVPFLAGSGTDTMARALANELQKDLGTPVIVDNRPGANGAIGADITRKSPADGYTLVLATSSGWSTNPWLFKALAYDPVKDFTPIARTTTFPFALVVSASSPIQNLDDFLKKAHQTQLSMGYGNATGQVAGAHLMKAAGFKAIAVPYKSTPPALVDLVGGQFDFMFVDVASSQGLIKAGKVRPLAVMADKRSVLLPNLPALGEKYPGFDYVPWGGLMAPRGLSPEITHKLNSITVAILEKPELKAKLTTLGLEASPSGSDEFGRFVKEQLKAWGDKAKDAGLERE